MTSDLLTSSEAAAQLGISRATLYAWLAQSDAGQLIIRGQSITIAYLQGGPRGQGRIRIESGEVQRLLSILRVTPKPTRPKHRPLKSFALQHISVQLGRPDD